MRGALRVAVPSSSICAVNPARPGASSGLASEPLLITSSAATSGSAGFGWWITVRPFGSVNDVPSGSAKRGAGPGFGGVRRHASSRLMPAARAVFVVFGGAGAGTSGPRSGLPGTPATTTRAFGCRYACATRRTSAALTRRRRSMSFGR